MNQNNLIEGNSLKFSCYGGIAIPPVTSMLDGYLQGAKYFNDHFKDGGTNASWKPMEPIFAVGNSPSDKDFSGGFAPGLATNLSESYLEKGAQIIVSVAGSQTADSVGAVQRAGKKGRAFVIGPDTDQSLVYDKDIILGTMAKGINFAAYSTLNDIYDGDPNTIPKDHNYVLHDQGKTQTDINKMYVGFLPSIAFVGSQKDRDVIASTLWSSGVDLADQERVTPGAEVTKIFESTCNKNNGVVSHSIDLIAQKFTNGHNDGTIAKFSDSASKTGLQNDSYLIVSDMRTDDQIAQALIKSNEEADKIGKIIDDGIANHMTLANGKNATTAKADARAACMAKYNKKIPGILFWNGTTWVKTMTGRQFSGGFYATW